MVEGEARLVTDRSRLEPLIPYKVIGGGRVWPGSPIDIPQFGYTTDDIDASALILDFFDQPSSAVGTTGGRAVGRLAYRSTSSDRDARNRLRTTGADDGARP
jgi:hypothetical protein